MRKALATTFFTFLILFSAIASDYENAWLSIAQKDYASAKILLQKAIQNPSTSIDAYATLLFLETYQGKENEIPGLLQKIADTEGRNAYLYSLWFNGSVLGHYSKKKSYQLNFINEIISKKTFNGSIQSAAHYVKALHYVFSNNHENAKEEYLNMGAIQTWQLAGPFENLSGSGFNTHSAPLLSPDAATMFTGINNIQVNWFTPLRMNNEGWIFTYAHLPEASAVVYAQAFVYSPEERTLLVNLGCNGSLKAWVNDGLVLSDAKERTTELDYYSNKCVLKKGYNRVLLQLSYTNKNTPNFIVRFTDENGFAIKEITSIAQVQPYQKTADAASQKSTRHFAEEFFEKKIVTEPSNPINYILLSQAYLRNGRVNESRDVMEKALKLSPSNPLLKFELIQSLLKSENRPALLQEIDWLKENDSSSTINYQIKINNLIKEEKYTEASNELEKMTALYGVDDNALETKAKLLGKLDRIEELVKLVSEAHPKYPENVSFLSMMYKVKKLVQKDAKGALGLYEKYLRTSYNYNVLDELAGEYKEQAMNDKYFAILKKLYDETGYDPRYVNSISKYYFEQSNYIKALLYAQEALKLAPYSGNNWYNVALIQEEMKDYGAAISSYKKTIYYNRTNYDARKKLSALEKKQNLQKLLPETDVYALIKKAIISKENDYTYLLDEKGTIVYDVGASEEYVTYAVKLHNQKGIDAWKELYLPYDENTQTILIEKSEVVKTNGSKINAERNNNELVFTSLEPGDAIHVKYRVQNYTSGRLGKEFWDKFTFNSFAPAITSRYTLVIPAGIWIGSEVINSGMKPLVKDVEQFKVYTWEQKELVAMKSEPMMPVLNDVATVLHISTVKTWADIASWYSDIAYQNLTDNYELMALYNQIFDDTKGLNDYQKAKRIYEYIIKNIRYSSVSFRQSGLVPQDISTIISAKLGDCKDLSTLFVALAAKAGIKSQLVLIDTRDNGAKDIVLPSMEFNHCIVLAFIDGKEIYLELTDSNLPFGSLPNNLYGALSLLVPGQGQKSDAQLKPLAANNRAVEKINRQINITVYGKDVKLAVTAKRHGSLTSAWRDSYATLTEEKRMEDFEQTIGNGYKNPVKLENLSFVGLEELADSLVMKYNYSVKNEIIEAGSMKMLKVPFIDVIATLENISAEKRNYPIEYWNYENTDVYETVVNIQLQSAQKLLEVPANVDYAFKASTYTIKYIRDGEKLKVYRNVKLNRQNILPEEYAGFQKFFNDIVEAESKYVVFK